MRPFFYVFVFVLTLLSSECSDHVLSEDCPLVFNVERAIKNRGFHRNVEYYFELLSDGELLDCKVCFKQTIPHGLFVNKDQLNELVRLGKIAATVEGSIDIEAPADKSSPHDVYVHAELIPGYNTWNTTVTLPVHTRYHRARTDGGLEEAVLPQPEVFLTCGSIPSSCLQTEKTLKSCPAVTDESEYMDIKYNTNEETADILIPIGNSSHYEIVQLFTFIVTWAGSKFIYYTILNNKPKELA